MVYNVHCFSLLPFSLVEVLAFGYRGFADQDSTNWKIEKQYINTPDTIWIHKVLEALSITKFVLFSAIWGKGEFNSRTNKVQLYKHDIKTKINLKNTGMKK